MSALFTAQYDGHCHDCGDDIEAGDDVGYWDGDLLCESCHALAADEVDDWGMS